MPILSVLTRRLGLSLLVLFGVATIVFLLTLIIPSDPASLYLGPRARPAEIAEVNARFGFDRPILEQYVLYVRGLLRGDLGQSLATKRPVVQELGSRTTWAGSRSPAASTRGCASWRRSSRSPGST